jgi:hypothetical protein
VAFYLSFDNQKKSAQQKKKNRRNINFVYSGCQHQREKIMIKFEQILKKTRFMCIIKKRVYYYQTILINRNTFEL